MRNLGIAATVCCFLFVANCGKGIPGVEMDTPEDTAKTVGAFFCYHHQRSFDKNIEKLEEGIAVLEAQVELYANKKPVEKELEFMRKKLTFMEEKSSELTDCKYETIGKEGDDSKNEVTVKLSYTFKILEVKDKEKGEFELKDGDRKEDFALNKLDGKWLLKD